MNWKRIEFDPVDTLFFRDGRPYHAGETTQSDVKSVFPPSPATLVGAVRAYYARSLGWNQSKQKCWTEDIISKIGNGGELNGLQFKGPLLTYKNEPVFPIPYNLVDKPPTDDENADQPTDLQLLQPSKPFHCDLGTDVDLPFLSKPKEGLKTLEKWWIKKPGLEQILDGKLPEPESLIHCTKLWSLESRIGIERDESTRTTKKEGGMYSPHHIRLCSEVKLNLFASGLPELNGLSNPSTIAPVGGESRACYLEIKDCKPDDCLPVSPVLVPVDGMIYFSLVTLTPLGISNEDMPAPNKPFLKVPGKLLSACLPRTQRWGGWDSVNHKPLPLKSYIPPGSVLFFEAQETEKDAIKELHKTTIGECPDWGFGLIAIGTWQKGEEK